MLTERIPLWFNFPPGVKSVSVFIPKWTRDEFALWTKFNVPATDGDATVTVRDPDGDLLFTWVVTDGVVTNLYKVYPVIGGGTVTMTFEAAPGGGEPGGPPSVAYTATMVIYTGATFKYETQDPQ